MPLDSLYVLLPGVIPSLNDYKNVITGNRFEGGRFESGWKDWAEWHTWEWLDQEILDELPIRTPAVVTVRVWRPNLIRRDIHNLFLKPVFDAFTEVGIWPDDSETYCPSVTYTVGGLDRINPRIEFFFRSLQ